MPAPLQQNQFSQYQQQLPDMPPEAGSNLQGFWDTLTGQSEYKAPEKVFDPMQAHDMSNYNNMQNAGSYYQGLMNGTVPSAANVQMQHGIAQANQNAMQAASGASGVNRAMAFRNAQQNASTASAAGAVAGGQQRLQEQQLGAQGYSQTQQGRENMQNQVLGLQNQAQANLNQQYQINADMEKANSKNESGSVGGMIAMAGAGLAALSDEGAKTDIKSLEPGVSVSAMPTIDAPPPALSSSSSGGGDGSGGGMMSMAGGMAGGMISDIKTKHILQVPQGSGAKSDLAGSGAGFVDLAHTIQGQPAVAGQREPNTSYFEGAPYGGYTSTIGAQDLPGSDGSATRNAAIGDLNSRGYGIDYSSGYVGSSDVNPSDTFFSDKASKEALDPVKPYQFDYKNKFAHELGMQAAKSAYQEAFLDAKQPRVGVMAQDLQKSPEGKEIVIQNPDGIKVGDRQALAIDGKRALGFLLANQADMNDRLKGLESRRA